MPAVHSFRIYAALHYRLNLYQLVQLDGFASQIIKPWGRATLTLERESEHFRFGKLVLATQFVLLHSINKVKNVCFKSNLAQSAASIPFPHHK